MSFMTPTDSKPQDTDFIQPFQIEGRDVRGRLVRLGPAASQIIRQHAYPAPVARLLAEMMALAAALAAALKYEGVFTLQTKGDGPVGLMVADVTSAGGMRGYAQFDAAAVAALPVGAVSLPRLLGAGYLAFTVDQGEYTDRYQGIVALTGASLVDCVHHYFQQSEQLQAGLRVATRQDAQGWRAGAIMIQRLPLAERADVLGTEMQAEADDAWLRALALMASCTDAELLDDALPINDLLYRLFHEDGVRVFAGHAVSAQCRCSRARIERVFMSMTDEELIDLVEDGAITATCEFCNSVYRFTPEELAMLKAEDRDQGQ